MEKLRFCTQATMWSKSPEDMLTPWNLPFVTVPYAIIPLEWYGISGLCLCFQKSSRSKPWCPPTLTSWGDEAKSGKDLETMNDTRRKPSKYCFLEVKWIKFSQRRIMIYWIKGCWKSQGNWGYMWGMYSEWQIMCLKLCKEGLEDMRDNQRY